MIGFQARMSAAQVEIIRGYVANEARKLESDADG